MLVIEFDVHPLLPILPFKKRRQAKLPVEVVVLVRRGVAVREGPGLRETELGGAPVPLLVHILCGGRGGVFLPGNLGQGIAGKLEGPTVGDKRKIAMKSTDFESACCDKPEISVVILRNSSSINRNRIVRRMRRFPAQRDAHEVVLS